MLFMNGASRISLKSILEVFSSRPLREGLLVIDISTPEKRAELESKLQSTPVEPVQQVSVPAPGASVEITRAVSAPAQAEETGTA